MPRGFLREPPPGLARADVVVLTRSDRAGADALAEAERRVRALAPQAAIVREVHAATELIGHDGSRIADVGALRGARVTCMSGIGDPTTLAESVTRCGAIVVRTLDFGDHHEFTPAELAAVARDCAADGVRWCVTTQKDAMRIGAVPAGLPLVVLRIEARFDGEAATNTMSALV